MVARSFQNMTIVSEIYKESGREYVTVKNEATGKTRKVRWYSEAEYARMYPNEKISDTSDTMRNQKKALGFEKGYITIFKGNTIDELSWFHQYEELRYHKIWGWYLPSTCEMPADMPKELTLIRLNWEVVSADGIKTNSETKLREVVDPLLYDPSPSKFIGEVGERIKFSATVIDKKTTENDYGFQNIHFFEDTNKNIYVWSTSAKNLDIGTSYDIVGTVKAHSTYKNCKQTWLTRCFVTERGQLV